MKIHNTTRLKMDKTREFFAKFKTDMDKVKAEIPDTLQGFGGLFQKVMRDGL